ncbi:class I SAM-dependent methyltransferase [bacterium]|nr:MAG: class I SAM-dependent methyltransferase [bacterium]
MGEFNFEVICKTLEDVSRSDTLQFDDSREVGWRDVHEQQDKFMYLVRMMKQHLRFIPVDFKILDVGCGTADLYHFMTTKKQFCDYTGIDLVKESIRKARKRYPELKGKLIVGNFLEHQFKKQFDVVLANGLFHWKGNVESEYYFEYVKKSLLKMYDLAKCGVVFNLITPSPSYYNQNQFYIKNFHSFFAFLYGLTRQIEMSTSYPAWDINIGLFKNRWVEI